MMFEAFLSAVWKTVRYEVARFKAWWKRRGEEIDKEEYPW
jgi:hypothetical protein